ncbi:hypothetical protein Tco_1447973 [Tanacetum coccineum]
MVEKSKQDEDPQGKVVDPIRYRGMIGTLMYLTSSRPDLVFAMCMCARYQAKPNEKHLHADSRIALTAFADANHAGCHDTIKSTSGSMQLLGDRLVSWSSKKQKSIAISSTEAEYIALSGCLSTGRHLHQAFSTRTTGISHQKAWNAKHVSGDSEKTGRRRGRVMVVLFTERVKISSTNVRLETTVPQKEETFQVVIDLIKNSSCFKAFTISADVLEIFMQLILDIYPRVEGVNFIDVPDDDTTLAFLIKLGYKGPLYKHTNMFVDHIHQPWRTLAAIINKENVDYPVLIWEDLNYQIDHRKEKRSRRENMPFPRFTKVIINHFLKQHNSLSNLKYQHYYTIKDDGMETVDVSKESEPEPEPDKRKTSSKRKVKKKVTLSADDNIISDDPDTALELGKSISKTEAEEAEAARQVHATHARIMTESVLEHTKRRKSGKVTSDPPKKLKGVPSLTPEEQEAVDTMQDFKESKKTSKRLSYTRGSSKGTGTIPGVPDESTVVSSTSSERTGTKPGVPSEEKDITKENIILEWGSKQESEYLKEDKLDDEEKDDKEGDAVDEDDETESDEDDIYKYKIHVRKDKDEEMLNAEVKDSNKGDEEVTEAIKENAEKTSEVKDDAKKTKLPSKSFSLSVSSGFGDQFLKISSNSSLVTTVKDTTDAQINSLLEVKIQSEVPHIQSPSMLRVPVSVISEPLVLTPIQESPLIATVTTLPPPSVSTTPSQIPKLPKKQTPTVDLEQESEKTPLEILKIKKEQAEKHKMPKFTIKSTDKAALKEYDQKSALYQTMHANKYFNINHANHRLYHALMKALIEDENVMDKGVADTAQDHKRKHDDDEDDDDKDPLDGSNQGKKTKRRRTKESESSKKPSTTKETPKDKAISKGSKTGKSALEMELVEEPIAEVVIDYASDDVVVLDQPEQPWFNQMVSATLDPLTFDDLMDTLIDFSKHVFYQHQTRVPLPRVFQCINMRLYQNNPKGDRYPFDLSKPLPLQGHLGHLTVAADYFFNNDLEYLKSFDPERMYTTSITKTKAARYEIEGIEDMVPTLWSPTKVKSVSVKKLHGYGHLEEIVVKRADHQFYKFKEGYFVDLHVKDIEDMLLLIVQHKLFHLTDSDIVDFNVALRMFTRSLVIKKRVEDLQLRVESYQKKLNITPPQ